MKCDIHPQVDTVLTCSKCGRPICPRCLVQTPVGARCPQCAALKRLPIFQVKPKHYLVASAIGLGVAVAFAMVWWAIWQVASGNLGYLALLIFVLMGYAIGELISLGVNRKRSPWLAAIAGSSTLIGFGLALSFHAIFSLSLYGLITLAAAIYIAISRLR